MSNIQAGMPVLADWLEHTALKDSPETWNRIEPFFRNGLDQMDWNAVLNTITEFLKNGMTSVMSDTMNTVWSIAGRLVSSVAEAIIALVFACYLLAKKEKYARQARKLLYAFLPEAAVGKILSVSRLCYTTFSRFVTGQCPGGLHSRSDLFCSAEYRSVSVCAADCGLHRIYGADSDFRSVYRLCCGSVSDPDGESVESIGIYYYFFGGSAD